VFRVSRPDGNTIALPVHLGDQGWRIALLPVADAKTPVRRVKLDPPLDDNSFELGFTADGKALMYDPPKTEWETSGYSRLTAVPVMKSLISSRIKVLASAFHRMGGAFFSSDATTIPMLSYFVTQRRQRSQVARLSDPKVAKAPGPPIYRLDQTCFLAPRSAAIGLAKNAGRHEGGSHGTKAKIANCYPCASRGLSLH
jgi:hypothetical protein